MPLFYQEDKMTSTETEESEKVILRIIRNTFLCPLIIVQNDIISLKIKIIIKLYSVLSFLL